MAHIKQMKIDHIILGLAAFVLFSEASCQKSKKAPASKPATYSYTWQQFVMGDDLSYVNAIEDAGGVYKENNKADDPYLIFSRNGCNTTRVRLWHNPTSWQQGLNGGRIYHNLPDVVHTIRRAKQTGMAVNLDLHYSDDWADPAKQSTPAAWAALPLSTLADSVYRYTLHVLDTLQSLGLAPEMIQVGNENNGGILWPVGKVENGNYASFATLLKAGINAVRKFSLTSTIKPQIILHVAQFQNAEAWLAGTMAQGVTDFDIVGVSHYYKWSTVSSMEAVSTAVAKLKTSSGKKVMVVETAFPFTNNNADGYNNIFYESSATAAGYPFTVTGQANYVTDLTKAIIQGGGSGIMVWEPAWITSTLRDRWGTGSSWENNAFFDFGGNLHSGISFYTKKYTF